MRQQPFFGLGLIGKKPHGFYGSVEFNVKITNDALGQTAYDHGLNGGVLESLRTSHNNPRLIVDISMFTRDLKNGMRNTTGYFSQCVNILQGFSYGKIGVIGGL